MAVINGIRTILFLGLLFYVPSLLIGAAESNSSVSRIDFLNRVLPSLTREQCMVCVLEAVHERDREKAKASLVEAALKGDVVASCYLTRCYEKDGVLTRCNPILKKYFQDWTKSLSSSPQLDRKVEFLENHIESSFYLSKPLKVSSTTINPLPLPQNQVIREFITGKISDDEFVHSVTGLNSSLYGAIFDLLQTINDMALIEKIGCAFHRLVWLTQDWAFENNKKQEWKILCSKDFKVQLLRCMQNKIPLTEFTDFLHRYYYYCPLEVVNCSKALIKLFIKGWNTRQTIDPRMFVKLLSLTLKYNPKQFADIASPLHSKQIDVIMGCALENPSDWEKFDAYGLSLNKIISQSCAHTTCSESNHAALASFLEFGTLHQHEQYKNDIIQAMLRCQQGLCTISPQVFAPLIKSAIPELRSAAIELAKKC
jgi:hypothetical protein